jgi:hypothetical protein
MKHRTLLIMWAIIIVVILPACADLSTATITPFRTPSVTPIPNLIFTPTIQPVVILPTISPTITLRPSETESPTSFSIIDLTATAYESTLEAPFLETPCTYVAQQRLGLSPDGKWVFCGEGENVMAIDRTGNAWTYSMSDFFGESGWNYDITLIYWTLDGEYIYFAPHHVMDWGDDTYYYDLYFALLRMDLNSGKVSTILPLENGFDTYYLISISPTGRRLAFSYQNLVIVRDLKTNTG